MQLAHLVRDQRAGPGAAGEDEVRDPHLAVEIVESQGGAGLGRELELRQRREHAQARGADRIGGSRDQVRGHGGGGILELLVRAQEQRARRDQEREDDQPDDSTIEFHLVAFLDCSWTHS